MHQNLAVNLWQFNYIKNSFIVLVPGPNSIRAILNDQVLTSKNFGHRDGAFWCLRNKLEP